MSQFRLRRTARVLLLDANDRILLLRGRLPTKLSAPGAWFTVGGGVENGESLEEAARREIVEESGITSFALGPLVWRGVVRARTRSGIPLRVEDAYFVARAATSALSRDGWQAIERELVDDMRWFSLAELAALEEDVYPPELPDLLPDVIAGRYPAEPIELAERVVD